MNVDLERLRGIVERDYAVPIEAHYGPEGMAALRRLAPALDDIHEQLAYEMLTGGLIVLTTLDEGVRQLQDEAVMAVDIDQLSGLVHGAATIEVTAGGQLLLFPEAVEPRDYADRALVYFFDGGDFFVVGEDIVAVPNATNFPSIWGTPTFFDLKDALSHYRDRIALHCQCPVLASVWIEDHHWLLKNKPEDTMQESLHNFLVNTLRAHKKIEVRREQPVGGRKPPDIKVTWTLTNRLAFIEVKWMGASVHASEDRITWRPDEDEANKGAGQLVGYLEENEAEAPGHQTMGFLVVFDGRRRGVDVDTDDLSNEDALYYLTRDITFDPDYFNDRHDLAPPVRCFMYPEAA